METSSRFIKSTWRGTMSEENNIVNTLKETDRKCPNCEGVMDFDPTTGGLMCPYCGYTEEIKASVNNSEGEVDENSTKVAERSLEDAENIENCDWGVATKTVVCKSCGAHTVYDNQQISSECPYCGSNQVMDAGDEKTMAPGGVIPFKIDQKEASKRFEKWLKGKFFAPKAAKENSKAKNFNGMYLPYWTFDAVTKSTYTGEFGKDRRVKKGDKEEIITDWFRTRGRYDEDFDDELIPGTNQHNQFMLNGIAPYNTQESKVYKPEYVAGFGAERYSIGIKAAWEKAKAIISGKIKSAINSKILHEHNADHVRNLNVKTAFSNITYKYLLLPVWIANYKYNGKVYQFMVNGETGKVSGKSPVSAIKVILTIAVIIAIFVLIHYINAAR